jgi:hypothetical protein
MGEAGRFFASVVGDALNGTITGTHSTAGLSVGATNGGLTVGSRSNLSLPDEDYTLLSVGTFAGAQVEINSGGANTDPTSSKTSILRMVIDGTITDTKWASVPLFDVVVPASLVSNSSYLVDLDASDATVGAKLRIRINDVYYWIMLADAAN